MWRAGHAGKAVLSFMRAAAVWHRWSPRHRCPAALRAAARPRHKP